MSTVLLFDLDGTLVNTGGAGRRAMIGAFASLHGKHDAFADFSFAGMTTPTSETIWYPQSIGTLKIVRSYKAQAPSGNCSAARLIFLTSIRALAFDTPQTHKPRLIFQDHAASATFPPAASVFVTDHAYVFEAVVGDNREAAGEWSRRRGRYDQYASAGATRVMIFFILNSSDCLAGLNG